MTHDSWDHNDNYRNEQFVMNVHYFKEDEKKKKEAEEQAILDELKKEV